MSLQLLRHGATNTETCKAISPKYDSACSVKQHGCVEADETLLSRLHDAGGY
ncbi:hypothetical protein EGR_10779 [Echinococcus granulosus]|uniref:Uncharacterized protein n=1 Tax=Echinococcus granulosus TaxID=6210 RepID=W6U7L4_ECHGR|nr:hypothetical protein EGR_10779 [Echinococcus granulosus]EUB54357.1 hypothetical protein EGR_10779 [Echinococcus granulosus]